MKFRDIFIASLLLVISQNISAKVDENQAIAQLAEKIVELRTQVENLNTEVNAEKEGLQGKLKSLQAKRAQISAQAEQTQLQIDQAQKRLETVKEELQSPLGYRVDLGPVIQNQIQNIKIYVGESLPFQKTKRLQAIKKIEDDLKSQTLTPQKVLARLWAFVEDELRLGRENGVHRQTLILESNEELVTVVKLGMVALFYQTSDESYGFVQKKEPGVFDYVSIRSPQQQALTMNLFEGLKKQIRTGNYTLPNIF
jgi:DNA repair exonuclease SbcCD ATPase subunit